MREFRGISSRHFPPTHLSDRPPYLLWQIEGVDVGWTNLFLSWHSSTKSQWKLWLGWKVPRKFSSISHLEGYGRKKMCWIFFCCGWKNRLRDWQGIRHFDSSFFFQAEEPSGVKWWKKLIWCQKEISQKIGQIKLSITPKAEGLEEKKLRILVRNKIWLTRNCLGGSFGESSKVKVKCGSWRKNSPMNCFTFHLALPPLYWSNVYPASSREIHLVLGLDWFFCTPCLAWISRGGQTKVKCLACRILSIVLNWTDLEMILMTFSC